MLIGRLGIQPGRNDDCVFPEVPGDRLDQCPPWNVPQEVKAHRRMTRILIATHQSRYHRHARWKWAEWRVLDVFSGSDEQKGQKMLCVPKGQGLAGWSCQTAETPEIFRAAKVGFKNCQSAQETT
jgi:hypothetical protein